MKGDELFYTKTMAGIHAGQGNYDKASEIYQYLLDGEPGRQDLKDALEGMEMKKKMQRLMPLIETWAKLMIKCRSVDG